MLATVGYIMKNRQNPIGIDKFPTFKDSKNRPNSGENLPNNKPIIIQIAIHKVRYFSNMPNGILPFDSFYFLSDKCVTYINEFKFIDM